MLKKLSIFQKKLALVSLIIAANALADQITKELARIYLQGKGQINVVGDIFIMRFVRNRGAFLGIFDNLPDVFRIIVLIVIPAGLLIALFIYLLKNKNLKRYELVCFGCIIGGGLSNVVDRIIYKGYVSDFLNFGIGPKFRTGVLNVADMSVTFGALALLIIYLVTSRKESADIKSEKGNSRSQQ